MFDRAESEKLKDAKAHSKLLLRKESQLRDIWIRRRDRTSVGQFLDRTWHPDIPVDVGCMQL